MKSKKAQFIAIFLTIFIDLLGFGIVIPIVPFYLESFLTDSSQIGKVMATMITSYSLMQFLFAPVWGRISDKVGRRPIILISLVGTAVSHVWFAMATEVWMLYASRILTGFFAATISSATAYISDITDESNRAKGMGIVGAAFGLGFILGPAVGGILSHFGGFKLPLLAAAGLSLASFVFAWFKLIESRDTSTPSETDYSRYKLTNVFMVLKHKRLGLLFTVFFIVALSFSNLETIFALYTERILSLLCWKPVTFLPLLVCVAH